MFGMLIVPRSHIDVRQALSVVGDDTPLLGFVDRAQDVPRVSERLKGPICRLTSADTAVPSDMW
jgi:hypothetical protein